jgi:hypothetical protein
LEGNQRQQVSPVFAVGPKVVGPSKIHMTERASGAPILVLDYPSLDATGAEINIVENTRGYRPTLC